MNLSDRQKNILTKTGYWLGIGIIWGVYILPDLAGFVAEIPQLIPDAVRFMQENMDFIKQVIKEVGPFLLGLGLALTSSILSVKWGTEPWNFLDSKDKNSGEEN